MSELAIRLGVLLIMGIELYNKSKHLKEYRFENND